MKLDIIGLCFDSSCEICLWFFYITIVDKMLYVVIHGTYYKDNVWFSSWNARQKKECVFFYDYDDYVKYIINDMDYSTLQKLRLNIYKNYQKQIKFTPF